jgi:hypothetical protein
MNIKMVIFSDVAPCSLLGPDVSEKLTASVIITLMMEGVSFSETLVIIYQTAWCNIPEEL